MQLASARIDGQSTAIGIDPERGFVVLSQLPHPLPHAVMDVIRHISARQFSDAVASAPDGLFHPLEAINLSAPYQRPHKIWGVGLNYADHADDLGAAYPDEPASFIKGDHTIIGPEETIDLPSQSSRVTAEGELGLVFAKTCRDANSANALDAVWGLCPVLDQTAEDILQRNPRFLTRAKNFPGFFSFGPTITPLHEVLAQVDSLADLQVATVKNDRVHRANTVANMLFSPEELIIFHSRLFPFFAGDILSTGTPGAVVIEDGDVAECRVTGLGSLRNHVRRSDPTSAQR